MQAPADPANVPADPANVMESLSAPADWEPAANPSAPEWIGVAGVRMAKGFFGEPVPLPPTIVRSRWTEKNLYLLFACPYRKLNLKANPVTNAETNQLWNWDVVEAFIGSDYLNTSVYKEFQVSPQGEFVDIAIDGADPKEQKGIEWQSGFTVAAHVDMDKKIWYGEMKIPFASLDVKKPHAGDELRIGLFRIDGSEPNRIYIAWRPTGATTFHVPGAFGSVLLK